MTRGAFQADHAGSIPVGRSLRLCSSAALRRFDRSWQRVVHPANIPRAVPQRCCARCLGEPRQGGSDRHVSVGGGVQIAQGGDWTGVPRPCHQFTRRRSLRRSPRESCTPEVVAGRDPASDGPGQRSVARSLRRTKRPLASDRRMMMLTLTVHVFTVVGRCRLCDQCAAR